MSELKVAAAPACTECGGRNIHMLRRVINEHTCEGDWVWTGTTWTLMVRQDPVTDAECEDPRHILWCSDCKTELSLALHVDVIEMSAGKYSRDKVREFSYAVVWS